MSGVWAFVRLDVVRITDAAIGVGDFEDETIEYWLPLSQIGMFSIEVGGDCPAVEEGDHLTAVQVPRWLANEKNLEIDD